MTSIDATGGYAEAATEQSRHPGGMPTGGQFTANPRQEPDVTLAHLSDEEYNADGTFDYPPIPRSPEQHIAFWLRVPVPSAILARVSGSYVETWQVWADDELDRWALTDPRPVAGKWLPKEQDIADWTVRFEAEAARVDAERPRVIPAVLARPLIRAAQMKRYASQWMGTQEQYNQVMDTEIDLGQPQPSTVRETLEEYHLDELPDGAFEDAGSYAGINAVLTTAKLTELVDLLREQTD